MSGVVAERNYPNNPARPVYTGVSAWLARLRPETALLPQDPNRQILSEQPLGGMMVSFVGGATEQPSCFPTVATVSPRIPNALMRSYMGAAYVETPMHRQIRAATHDIPSVQLSIRTPLSAEVLQQWQLVTASV